MKLQITTIILLLLLGSSGHAIVESPREVVVKVDGMFCSFCTFGIGSCRAGSIPLIGEWI